MSRATGTLWDKAILDFDQDDPYIHSDAVFGVKESLIAQYKDTTPEGSDQKQWEVEFDFVLARG